MPAIDSLIAALALNTGLQIVTRNEDDFVHCGVPLVNPWRRAGQALIIDDVALRGPAVLCIWRGKRCPAVRGISSSHGALS